MSSTTINTPLKILITGGARGIGRGLSRHFISTGHSVIILDNNRDELQHTSSLIPKWAKLAPSPLPPQSTTTAAAAAATTTSSSSGDTAAAAATAAGPATSYCIECDLTDRQQIKSAVAWVAKEFGGSLDVLVNNACSAPGFELEMEDEDGERGALVEEEWDAKLAVGLTAPFLLSRLCVGLLARGRSGDGLLFSGAAAGGGGGGSGGGEEEEEGRGSGGEGGGGSGRAGGPGCIINISSTRAAQSEPNHEAYSAAKAGLLGLTQSMAVSLGLRHGIRVNAVLPGWIHVADENREADEMGRRWEEGLGKEDHGWHLVGRVGGVGDVVRAVEYLVRSGFVSGEEVRVDGGVGRRLVYPE